MKNHMNQSRQRGFNLMEVVVGIAVFFIGLLALAALQGSLTRNMAEAKMRTVAANLAEEEIERLRGFTELITTPGAFAYQDITNNTGTVTSNGVIYTIQRDVSDWIHVMDAGGGTFCEVGPGCALTGVVSTFKKIEVVVGWDGAQRLRTVEGTEVSAVDLMEGNETMIAGIKVTGLKLTGVIPALVTSASSRVSDQDETGDLPTPGITYTPGSNPDVIALSLGDNKFKESLLPMPEVIRTDKVETTFDVITYSQDGLGATFLRRDEFTTVSCECTLETDGSTAGRRPAVWAGDEYAGMHFVETSAKDFGTSATNQQSELCNTCCRDHHDGGTGAEDHSTDSYSNVYGPFKGDGEYTGSARDSNHRHYQSDGITPALDGNDYLESCRMVRVNGFLRVAQDFRREDQYLFPDDYLDGQDEIDVYSGYVTGATTTYYNLMVNGYPAAPPCIGHYDYDNNPLTTCDDFPNLQGAPQTAWDLTNDELPTWTAVKTTVRDPQQLRSRGIYIDYVSDDLRAFITACIDGNGDLIPNCTVGDVDLDQTGSTNLLEILPFFDVQLTFLNNWREEPSATVVETTSEPLDDFNAHSRGEVSQVSLGNAEVEAKGHRGNPGFTDTPAIDPLHDALTTNATLTVCSLDASGAGDCGVTPPPSINPLVVFDWQNIDATPAPSPGFVQGTDAFCQPGASTWGECELTGPSPWFVVNSYGRNSEPRWACSATLPIISQVTDGTLTAHTVFDLSGADTTITHVITIQESACAS